MLNFSMISPGLNLTLETNMLNKLIIFLFCLLTLTPALGSNTPSDLLVVVSIKPIHSLTAALMVGVGEPKLLLPENVSPHTYQLKPSHLKLLQSAKIIIWVGENLETSLARVLRQYPNKTLTLMNIPSLSLIKQRKHRDFSIKLSADHGDHGDHNHLHLDEDPHIWLSIDNAKVISQAIAQVLIAQDPHHRARYQKNLAALLSHLDALKLKIKEMLSQKKPKPYLVFHDAYQYFERSFHIDSVGSIFINPHLPLSARALHDIQKLIQDHHVQCVYYETEFSQRPLQPILKEMNVQLLELDPLGYRQTLGPKGYEETMLALTEQLMKCQ